MNKFSIDHDKEYKVTFFTLDDERKEMFFRVMGNKLVDLKSILNSDNRVKFYPITPEIFINLDQVIMIKYE